MAISSNREHDHFSAAIVGAGPAGATCANALLRAGVSDVALIDRARFPRDKSCGDGIGPGVVPILDALDLGHLLEGRKRAINFTIAAFQASPAVFTGAADDPDSPLGYVIPRFTFDDALCRAAMERGAHDLTGWALSDAEYTQGRWHLSLKGASGDRRLVTADVLIGADGARSRVRRALGQPFNADAHTGVAIRAYGDAVDTANASLRLDIREDLPRPGYAWLFTDERGLANVGWGALATCFKDGQGKLDALLDHYAATRTDRIRGPLRDHSTAILPFASRLPPLAYPERSAALIGDAASMINPLTGEGIFYGMLAGLWLGEELGAALKRGGNPSEALSAYEQRYMAYLGRHFRETHLLRVALSPPAAMSLFCRIAARSPHTFRRFIEFMFGPVPPRKPATLVDLAMAAVGLR
ncbi:MAG: NAD(P)/FAD-dependent oxidoreductase [Hyphomicrobiaceae bacterium]|nr:NAD(P)/FAD-dependent oxidoreductase [Hyphomicrobiaceae bacterium]